MGFLLASNEAHEGIASIDQLSPRWRRRRVPAALARLTEGLIRAVFAPIVGPLASLFARLILAGRRPGARIERLVHRLLLQPSGCCPSGSPQLAFMRTFGRIFSAEALRAIGPLPKGPRRVAAHRWLSGLIRVAWMHQLRYHGVVHLRCVLGLPPPLFEVQLAPFPDCALGCQGCYARPDHGGRLPDRERFRFLMDEALCMGAAAIHIIGKGEPFAHRQAALALLSAIAEHRHLLVTIATAGQHLHLDDELLCRLAALDNVFLFVSIDGPAELHDARRGPGSFARALATMTALLQKGVPFGYSCMASRKSWQPATEPAFVAAMRDAGCLLGAYVRYFPLAADASQELGLAAAETSRYLEALAEARPAARIPLVDLDELEAESGCRSRAGLSAYLDGVTGQVAPCLRLPFAPEECRLDPQGKMGLDACLAHPFFDERRRSECSCGTCGADLGAMVADTEARLAAAGCSNPALVGYRERAAGANLEADIAKPASARRMP
jgi:hypothetical protein